MAIDLPSRREGLVRITRRHRILVAILAAMSAGSVAALAGDGERALGAEERQQIERGLRQLTTRLETLRGGEVKAFEAERDRLADAEVFAKGIAWALKYDAGFVPTDLKLLKTALDPRRPPFFHRPGWFAEEQVAMTRRDGHAPKSESNKQVHPSFEHVLKPAREGGNNTRSRER
jgi:hypothetical protein